ncbi:hypothetical protein BP6252_13711 [Coleophoma cylindrospora]|uniref:Uncharacterized protein n=1 Tax=Coleophoma cylindrospora TaxID=1849047 RepID=A0A3D8Q750_9HELO|nr:hypothetical protein BP6252_13711 [Coleophoma cylindrospora]
MDKSDGLVRQLEKLSVDDSCSPGLNTVLRQRLKEFAHTRNHNFQQDNIGNIYITRAGSDSELSAIAVTFPLDSSNCWATLSSALQVFLDLESIHTSCDITLLGWSSPHDNPIGHNVWEGAISLAAGYEQAAELKQFASLEDVRNFSLSANFQLLETDEPLVAKGSPVLIQKLQEAAAGQVKVILESPISKRVPVLSIQGKGAIAVAKLSVEYYSRYVVGLFENFD